MATISDVVKLVQLLIFAESKLGIRIALPQRASKSVPARDGLGLTVACSPSPCPLMVASDKNRSPNPTA